MLGSSKYPVLHYADVMCSVMNPSDYDKTLKGELESSNGYTSNGNLLKCVNNNNILSPDHCKQNTLPITSYNLGGLAWSLPQEHNIEDYLLFWIGPDNPAFANVVLTFNNCEIGINWIHFVSYELFAISCRRKKERKKESKLLGSLTVRIWDVLLAYWSFFLFI